MIQLSASDLIRYFSEHGNEFETDYGMLLSMTDEEDFTAEYWLPAMVEVDGTLHDSADLRVKTDSDTAHSFIERFKLTNASEINRICYNDIWMRYLNGDAIFYAKLRDQNMELGFRLIHSKTIVFNRRLHFYDEYDSHLTMPQELFDYIKRNEALLKSRL